MTRPQIRMRPEDVTGRLEGTLNNVISAYEQGDPKKYTIYFFSSKQEGGEFIDFKLCIPEDKKDPKKIKTNGTRSGDKIVVERQKNGLDIEIYRAVTKKRFGFFGPKVKVENQVHYNPYRFD